MYFDTDLDGDEIIDVTVCLMEDISLIYPREGKSSSVALGINSKSR
jgi:hypothetical protein